MEHLHKTITNNGIPIREVHFVQSIWGAIFLRNNLLIRKEIDTQPPTAQGKTYSKSVGDSSHSTPFGIVPKCPNTIRNRNMPFSLSIHISLAFILPTFVIFLMFYHFNASKWITFSIFYRKHIISKFCANNIIRFI